LLNINELSILLIEPSGTQARIITEHLVSAGVRSLDLCKDGKGALSHMNRYVPDLVVSSLYLPDMTGTELVQKMRHSESLHDVPFMLISSERRFRVLDPIRQSGVIAILPKPFDHDDLKNALIATASYIQSDTLELENYEIDTLRVLLVDDSTMARRHVMRILTNLGFANFLEAANGQQAIDVLSEHEVDLIVTDYNMPEMDGEQMVNYIRNVSEKSYLPILMITSEQDGARLNQVRQAGVSAILDKPFEIKDIQNMLYHLLNG